MNLLRTASMILLLTTLASASYADSVLLTNGDHVTGAIVDSDGASLTIKTDYAGPVKIQWSSVKEVTSSKPIYVTTSAHGTVNGSVAVMDGNLIVHTAQGDVTVPLKQITIVRSADSQAAYEKTLHPSLTRDWDGHVAFGLALARGNTDTTSINSGVQLDRKTLSDLIDLHGTTIYTKNSASTGGGITASALLAGARYDRNLTSSLFAFVGADFAHDNLQGLDLQSIYGGGLGWHLIQRPNTTFDVLGGLNYTRESYSSSSVQTTPPPPPLHIQRNLIAATIGDDFQHKFGSALTFAEHFSFYPDISNPGQYRFALDTSAETTLSKWLSWQITYTDTYVSDPPIPGTKSNDTILSTGLDVKFTH